MMNKIIKNLTKSGISIGKGDKNYLKNYMNYILQPVKNGHYTKSVLSASRLDYVRKKKLFI